MPRDAADELGGRIHARLVAEAGGAVLAPGHLRAEAARLALSADPLLGAAELGAVVEVVASRVEGLGPLDPLLADATVTEVMVNGTGEVWVERHGHLERAAVHLDRPMVGLLIERIVAPLGLRVDRTSPMVDARLPDGSRINAVVPPLAVDGPCLTIRRFGARVVELDSCCAPGVADLLRRAVVERANIVVSGGTGAGKTTLLNALAAAIPPGERIVTVEDAAELRLAADHVVRLEARPANAEGVGEVGIRQLVRNALRMRPDRLLVGEVRGPEALDMLQAMNTGHEGSLSTCHANSPLDALRRLETMVLSGAVALPLDVVRDHLAAAVDLVVQVARRPDGSRAVVEVAEVLLPSAGETGGVRVRRLADSSGVRAAVSRPARRATPRPDAEPASEGR